MKIKHFRELDFYQNALKAAMEIFEISKRFPNEERLSLTDPGRRSSRSVCANISETWRKRRYAAAFVSKLNDAEGEAAETQVHIEIASLCGYLDGAGFQRLDDIYDMVIGQLVNMAEHPGKWTTH
jgi:four helix bundle protein